jgi:glucosamine-6-phosphate deaminase
MTGAEEFMTPIGPPAEQQRGGPGEVTRDEISERSYGRLVTRIYPSAAALGAAAAADFAEAVRDALQTRDDIGVIFASASSQLPFLGALRTRRDIAWDRIHVLHMDEYLGMRADHPASFRRFLDEQLIRWVNPASFRELRGDSPSPRAEIARYSTILRELDPAICVLGIGENGHLAFNDPPADFATDDLVHLVTLDDDCRRQQWSEGHFPRLDDVPGQALSLTIRALLNPGRLFCIVPEGRKAAAVRAALEGPVSPTCPASILRSAASACLYLDPDSAALLSPVRPLR